MSKDQILTWGQYPLQKGTLTIAITGNNKRITGMHNRKKFEHKLFPTTFAIS